MATENKPELPNPEKRLPHLGLTPKKENVNADPQKKAQEDAWNNIKGRLTPPTIKNMPPKKFKEKYGAKNNPKPGNDKELKLDYPEYDSVRQQRPHTPSIKNLDYYSLLKYSLSRHDLPIDDPIMDEMDDDYDLLANEYVWPSPPQERVPSEYDPTPPSKLMAPKNLIKGFANESQRSLGLMLDGFLGLPTYLTAGAVDTGRTIAQDGDLSRNRDSVMSADEPDMLHSRLMGIGTAIKQDAALDARNIDVASTSDMVGPMGGVASAVNLGATNSSQIAIGLLGIKGAWMNATISFQNTMDERALRNLDKNIFPGEDWDNSMGLVLLNQYRPEDYAYAVAAGLVSGGGRVISGNLKKIAYMGQVIENNPKLKAVSRVARLNPASLTASAANKALKWLGNKFIKDAKMKGKAKKVAEGGGRVGKASTHALGSAGIEYLVEGAEAWLSSHGTDEGHDWNDIHEEASAGFAADLGVSGIMYSGRAAIGVVGRTVGSIPAAKMLRTGFMNLIMRRTTAKADAAADAALGGK